MLWTPSSPAGTWLLGLVPRQNSSGGKERLGGITTQGDRYLRQITCSRRSCRNPLCPAAWNKAALVGSTTKVAAVALANKMARMIWAIMTSGERYSHRRRH
ncbi:transposase [Mesorhizobium sp. WSM2239]|uniref:Transposase n=2 Tax=unclassified Mesorhizobium TaxID=325217 RepID=A0AAU8DEQ5_9HYPH